MLARKDKLAACCIRSQGSEERLFDTPQAICYSP